MVNISNLKDIVLYQNENENKKIEVLYDSEDFWLQQAELIVFPECALTGYPPRDLPDSKAVDAEAVT